MSLSSKTGGGTDTIIDFNVRLDHLDVDAQLLENTTTQHGEREMVLSFPDTKQLALEGGVTHVMVEAVSQTASYREKSSTGPVLCIAREHLVSRRQVGFDLSVCMTSAFFAPLSKKTQRGQFVLLQTRHCSTRV
ncbi:hypothetical protein [Roseobacter cerasinus]|uniref:hypothetical protein n=1 Tax=Roseobacter cerasinus TaxID=2602289 RepID=UPI001EEB22BF|nr:hypothetical protein [Roseobacter cerasinus]